MAPGADQEVCTWTEATVATDQDLVSTTGYQTVGGHHIILYATSVHQPVGTTRLCKDTDMVNFRMVGAAAGEGALKLSDYIPKGVVFRIPAGSQLVVNHHYINATDKTIDVQTAVDLLLGPTSPSDIPTGSLAVVNTTFDVPAGKTSSATADCTFKQEIKAWLLVPHEHEYGMHNTITLDHAGTTSTLSDVDWMPYMAFEPPVKSFPISAPLTFEPGDTIHVNCTWNNSSSSDLYFPREMCVGFAFTLTPGDVTCTNGSWGM